MAATSPDLPARIRSRTLARTGAGRRLRERAGVSLHELAAAVLVSPSTVSRWERGLARPRGAAAERYADALDVLSEATR
jgi:DNA-binding transcriptional regulator YiaG